MHRKRKCEKCRGRGGWYVARGHVIGGVWQACVECRGKGSWWPNNERPRQRERRV